jgi:hypothetical protein
LSIRSVREEARRRRRRRRTTTKITRRRQTLPAPPLGRPILILVCFVVPRRWFQHTHAPNQRDQREWFVHEAESIAPPLAVQPWERGGNEDTFIMPIVMPIVRCLTLDPSSFRASLNPCGRRQEQRRKTWEDGARW